MRERVQRWRDALAMGSLVAATKYGEVAYDSLDEPTWNVVAFYLKAFASNDLRSIALFAKSGQRHFGVKRESLVRVYSMFLLTWYLRKRFGGRPTEEQIRGFVESMTVTDVGLAALLDYKRAGIEDTARALFDYPAVDAEPDGAAMMVDAVIAVALTLDEPIDEAIEQLRSRVESWIATKPDALDYLAELDRTRS